jgi:hypothetical protein
MTATYTFDVFSSLDGYGAAGGNWTGYWGKQGPELLDHRLALYGQEQRMVFGASTYLAFARMLASSTEESEARDPWVAAPPLVTVPLIVHQDALGWCRQLGPAPLMANQVVSASVHRRVVMAVMALAWQLPPTVVSHAKAHDTSHREAS